MPEPSKIPQAWAADGDYNVIPTADPGTGLCSWPLGFPTETQTPIAAGGTPPRRQDMNGALNWLSQHLLWAQQGGLWQYDALENYEVGNVVLQNNSLYYCIRANGPASTVRSPANDSAGTYWRALIYSTGKHPDPDHLANPAVLQVLQAVYPVGSIYCSYGNTSPATLFGFGQWTKIEGRFLLGANSTYSLGSTGGEATVALKVAQLPAHSHSASSASAGAHMHTITVNSGGAHTHSASSASAGEHTHTRGTMEITGKILSIDDEYLTFADSIQNTGALYLSDKSSSSIGYAGHAQGGGYNSLNLQASRSWSGATSLNGAHIHSITVNSGGAHTHGASSASAGAHTHSITVSNTGSGQAHNNMPPYLAVNMWRRTA